MTETTARARTTGAAHFDAFGKSGRHSVIMPKVPTLSSTPTSSTATPAGAPAAAARRQGGTRHNGALIAKGGEKTRKRSRPTAGGGEGVPGGGVGREAR